jgi:hypothetical protein
LSQVYTKLEFEQTKDIDVKKLVDQAQDDIEQQRVLNSDLKQENLQQLVKIKELERETMRHMKVNIDLKDDQAILRAEL